MQGNVYIVKAENYYKIGKTIGSVENRIKMLQTGCPFKMKLVALYNGDYFSEIEKELHIVCIDYDVHIHLEWFELDKMIDFFQTLEIDYDFKIDYNHLNNIEII